jgi:hypothetical protein
VLQSVDGFLEFNAFMFGNFEVETAEGAGSADDGGPAEASVTKMVVAGNRQNAELVVEDAV